MTRRLLGYVVKLPDGTRSPSTPTPMHVTDAADKLLSFAPMGSHLVPVFSKPKPAPAEGAAEGLPPLFVVLHGYKGSFDQLYIGGSVVVTDRRAEAERRASEWKGDGVAMACQVFAVGAFEAACEAAAERGRIEALTSIRDACEFKADTVHDGPAMGLRMAMVLVDNAFKRLGEEKGQAK